MVARNYTSFSLDPTLKRSEMTERLRRDDDNSSEDLRGSQPSAIILTKPKSAINGGSAPRDNLYSPDRQRSLGHIDEPQRQISSEELAIGKRQPLGKDPWNQWTTYTLTLLQLEQTTGSSGQRGTGPRLSLVSPKVFSPFCHRWSFRCLPLSPLACLVGDT